jgi:hypothetical protein
MRFFLSFCVFSQRTVKYPSNPYLQFTLPILLLGYTGRFVRPIVCLVPAESDSNSAYSAGAVAARRQNGVAVPQSASARGLIRGARGSASSVDVTLLESRARQVHPWRASSAMGSELETGHADRSTSRSDDGPTPTQGSFEPGEEPSELHRSRTEATTPPNRSRLRQILCEEPSTELVHSWIGPSDEVEQKGTPRSVPKTETKLLTRTAYSELRRNLKSERLNRRLFMKELDEAVTDFERTEIILRSQERELHQGLALLNHQASGSAEASAAPSPNRPSPEIVQGSSVLRRRRLTPARERSSGLDPGLAALRLDAADVEIEKLGAETKAIFLQTQQVSASLAQMAQVLGTLLNSMNDLNRREPLDETRSSQGHAPADVHETSTERRTESGAQTYPASFWKEPACSQQHVRQSKRTSMSALLKVGGALTVLSVPVYLLVLWLLFEEMTYWLV